MSEKEETPGTTPGSEASLNTNSSLRKAKKVPPFSIRREVLEHMDPIYQAVAERCIGAGRWVVEE